MIKKWYTPGIVLLFLLAANILLAQEEAAETSRDTSWTKGIGVGLDFAQLFQLNPKQGAGQNRLGLGGALTLFANYKKGRTVWDNLGSWQFSVQRIGSGVVAQGSTEKIPFEKVIDELRFGSNLGFRTTEKSKFYWAFDWSFLSQITTTYEGNVLKQLPDASSIPLSKFLAPATTSFSAGISYKPTPNFSLFYSPISARFIIVADDGVASRGVHGNPVEGEPNADGFYTTFQNVDSQLGSILKGTYGKKFAGDRLVYISTLILYSNYLRNPQNIDIDWTNELGLVLWKNLQLTLNLNVFYDDDIRVQITDNSFPGGIKLDPDGNPLLGQRVSFTQQLLIKYNISF